jgi:hypothetical protein
LYVFGHYAPPPGRSPDGFPACENQLVRRKHDIRRETLIAGSVAFVLLALPPRLSAQGVDLTLFVGKAFPTYDERLTLTIPPISGADFTTLESPLIRADGGSVFGGALALEWGIAAIEGRVDSTQVGLEFTGARYELRGNQPPFQDFAVTLSAAPGRFDADRVNILSLNARVRTPGPIALVVSGGLSYLPEIRVTGSVPLRLEASGFPQAAEEVALTLRATPGESGNRFGVNAGAGLRIGGRVALMAEARVFYFKEFELRFDAADDSLDELLAGLDAVRFTPVFVNVQAGLVFRF